MTREEFKNKSFDEVMEQLNEEQDDVTTREKLTDFAKEKIDDGNLFVAIHILQALNESTKDWFEYDYCMGTLQTPSEISEKEDVEHMIDD